MFIIIMYICTFNLINRCNQVHEINICFWRTEKWKNCYCYSTVVWLCEVPREKMLCLCLMTSPPASGRSRSREEDGSPSWSHVHLRSRSALGIFGLWIQWSWRYLKVMQNCCVFLDPSCFSRVEWFCTFCDFQIWTHCWQSGIFLIVQFKNITCSKIFVFKK